jgi:hypothetical protein
MVSLPKPQIIFTHESDLDGLVAGVLLQRLARRLFDVDVPLEAHHYHTWRQREPRESAAWVCDLSFEARLDRPNWVIIDHHAIDVVPKKAQLVHDLAKSAGLLCYELCRDHELNSLPLDRLVHLNNVADLFLENDPDFSLANDYANLVKVYGFWNLHALLHGRIESLLDHPLLEVMQVKRRVEDPLGFEWSRQHVQALSPSVGYVDTVIGNNNLIIHQLLETRSTPYSVLITLFRRPNGVIIASLRSRNGEALKVAEKLQGGGHANASGATMPKSVRTIAEAVSYLKQAINPPPRKDTPLNNLENLFAEIEAKGR